jgi:hypothetical protein
MNEKIRVRDFFNGEGRYVSINDMLNALKPLKAKLEAKPQTPHRAGMVETLDVIIEQLRNFNEVDLFDR